MALARLGTIRTGAPGDDNLRGALNADWFVADAGNDRYDGASPVIGGPYGGYDRIAYDTVSYENAPSGVNVNLQTGLASDGWGGTDRLVDIAYIWGSMFDDVLIGDNQKNWISGLKGNDLIDGGPEFGYVVEYMDDPSGVVVNLAGGFGVDGWGGRDTIRNMRTVHGGMFDDVMTGDGSVNEFWGRGGNDFFDGGAGFDTIRYWSSGDLLDPTVRAARGAQRTGVYVDLSQGFAIDEWNGRDSFKNIEAVDDGAGDDEIIGDGGNNVFFVRGGADIVRGGGGADSIDLTRNNGGGLRAQYKIFQSGSNTIVSDVANPKSVITLNGVETIKFGDKTVFAPDTLDPVGVAIADQLSVVYLGRGVGADWRNATATVVAKGASPDLLKAFFAAGEADGAFAASDSLQTIANKTFNNIFGVDASAFEQNAWAATVGAGYVAKEALPWAMFNSYLGATNVPISYQVPAQSRIIAVNAFTNQINGANDASLSLGASPSIANAERAWLKPIRSQADAAQKVIAAASSVDGFYAQAKRSGYAQSPELTLPPDGVDLIGVHDPSVAVAAF